MKNSLKKDIKPMEADDQAIQTILMGLPKDIYDAVDSCETAQEIWLRVQQMMKGSDIGAQEKKAKLFNEWERFTSTDGESIESYYHRFSKLMNDFKRNKHFPEKITKDLHQVDYTQLYDFLKMNQEEVNELRAERLAKTHDPLAFMVSTQTAYTYLVFHSYHPSQITYMQQSPPNNNFIPQPSFNTNYMQQPMLNPDEINDPTTAMNMALVLMAKSFKLNYSTPTNNNQRISSNPHNRQIAQPGMNMVGVHNAGNQVMQNPVQNPGIQKVGNQNGLIVVQGITKQNENGNVVAARAEGSGNENNGNQIRCYNCKGVGHYARNYTIKPRRRDTVFLQTRLMIAQKEEAGIQLQAKEFDLMASTRDIKEIDNVISGDLNVEHSGGTVDQNRATVEETHAYFESLYNNLVIEVKKVNTVNRKMHEANAELTTKLSRYKGNDKCFEINQEKYAKLERCYQKSVYQERCLTKKLNALQLSSPKTITTLDEEIENLNNQLSKEKAIVSYLQEERKKFKTDFKKREHEFLDKQIQ
ncbi:hypothetical protein Tco_1149594, partial [Tanacetum coccineum]